MTYHCTLLALFYNINRKWSLLVCIAWCDHSRIWNSKVYVRKYIQILPNFLTCLHQAMETRATFSISEFQYTCHWHWCFAFSHASNSRGTSTWCRHPTSETGLSPQCSSPKLLSNVTYPHCAMLEWLFSGNTRECLIGELESKYLRVLQRSFANNSSWKFSLTGMSLTESCVFTNSTWVDVITKEHVTWLPLAKQRTGTEEEDCTT